MGARGATHCGRRGDCRRIYHVYNLVDDCLETEWTDYRDFANGLVAVACCAAAVKFVFNVRLSYWRVLILVSIVIALIVVGLRAMM
jgi:hypothetical protein